MRVEQQLKNMYTKHPDKIDAYLIRVIQRYFSTDKADIKSTKEEIILEAVNRIKRDVLRINSLDLDESFYRKDYIDNLKEGYDTLFDDVLNKLRYEVLKLTGHHRIEFDIIGSIRNEILSGLTPNTFLLGYVTFSDGERYQLPYDDGNVNITLMQNGDKGYVMWNNPGINEHVTLDILSQVVEVKA